jgi:hypothetical protein
MSRIHKSLRIGFLLALLALAFFGTIPTHAAIALDSKADCATGTTGSSGSSCAPSSGGTSTTLSWSHTIGSGTSRILLVGVSFRVDNGGLGAGTFITGIKLGTTALTCVAAIDDNAAGSCSTGTSGTVFLRSEIWSLVNPASGAATITVTSNSATTIVGSSASFSGVLNVTTGGTGASNNGVTGSTTASHAVTSASGNLVFGNVALAKLSGGNPITVTSNNTNLSDLADNASSGSHVHGNASDSTAVNPTMSWTLSLTSPWAVATAVLTPVPKHRGEVIEGAALLDERPFEPFLPARKSLALE